MHWSIVDMIVGYTKLYGHREKLGTSFEITNETFYFFLVMLLLSGYHNLPYCKKYWKSTPDTFVKVICDSIPRNTFE